ncbi:CCAAT/enhancer-binding protein gamma-like [Callorhinchus milii]|uniref:CCAAT/enhancer-binding protein gamma n=1 Tax=Callorhinchus milii TaxID=7868 RepID=V9L748_CALMI|nr:CCAAT/enhancer-binding protein gamma [Callorhinchus milii]XP_042196217.1 CCAAT/enhancer-binding protein gamma-like [Callorhinchus milii]|eukprot:gi/632978773/ref/XP_007906103.1/ PREDICTED: CCAAT/enhancer-binding protein gamma [Callorhinchus milii]
MSKQSVICTQPRKNLESNGVSAEAQHLSSGGQVPSQLVPVTSSSRGKAMAPSKQPKKQEGSSKESVEYRQRRERNNLAVRKSRLKSKQKAQDTQQRVTELKEENERLEAKIKLLSKELSVLKDLFLEHAHGFTESRNAGHEPSNMGQ